MKNIIKIFLTIAITILAYKYAEIERGYTAIIGGGEMFVPLMCVLMFWHLPKMIKNLKKGGQN